jgi:carbon-monoxide dehydrogenase medium subunit
VKPSAFDYSRPDSLGEAVEILAELGSDGKVLAGGQSLLPILSMRLAAPAHLVDINRIAELSYVRADPAGVRVGALARHRELERDGDARRVQPLLSEALRYVAHPTIRNRGTSVGSIVHADPSGEMPAILCLLGGSVTVASRSGRRTVAGGDFFLGPLESAVQPGELAIEAFFPALARQSGTAFTEVSRRHGDYAVCGVGVVVTVDDDLRIVSARAGYLSVAPTPLVVDLTEAIAGRSFDSDLSDVARCARAAVDPEPDIHASADYRRHLVGVLTARAVRSAAWAAGVAA